ncbi:glutathione-dependent formaldehyde-activating family gfa protein [Rutstroemia sp. NJR-2017a BVV2]|nr:glutathione-dependent formaldehyde-activating family gfa protein [Rutstroemia sp. NJR-2017a BVV2]
MSASTVRIGSLLSHTLKASPTTFARRSYRLQEASPFLSNQVRYRPFSHSPRMASHLEEQDKDPKSKALEQGSKSHEVEGEHNEWKFREPYKVHENDPNFKALYEGGCHCGRVKYQLSREKPLDAKFCHCSTCQVIHGAPFQWAAIFHKGDINFTHGHHELGWYDSQEKTTKHKLPCKVSCAYCRTPIMDEGRNMILLFPTLLKFKSKEEKDRFMPTCHMFYGKRITDIPDGLPKWTGINGESELIEDSPPELVRKRKKEIEEEEQNGKKEQKKE